MCGIAGCLLRDREPTQEMLAAMAAAQRHRGPDNEAVKLAGRAGFAHNRLSILDVSAAAHQPFFDDRYILCYNGEIYNYRELGEQLAAEGVALTTTSDTEVLFHALVCWGIEKTLRRIDGMFAFSFHDTREDVTYLCRDHFGIKPLYWIERPEGIYWASEVKALAAVLPLELDPLVTMFSVLNIAEAFHHYTVFKEVSHVTPGTYLIVDRKAGLRPRRIEYFGINELIDEDYYRELARLPRREIVGRFESLMQASVKKMLISDVPLGVFVSGGIDSSLIAAYAHQHNPQLHLFTADVVGKYSEYEDAKALAESLSLPLHQYRFEREMFLRDWARTTWHYETPMIYFTNAVPFANVARLAHEKGIKPVLTGEASDELFLGYPGLIYERFLKVLRLPLATIKMAYGVVPRLSQKVFAEAGDSRSQFVYQLVAGYDRMVVADAAVERFGFLAKKDAKLQALTAELLRNHIFALLFRNDRMGMQGSIEARFPYLDMELVRFGMNLPHRWKIRRVNRFYNIKHPFFMDKFIVREAAKRALPDKLTRKPKWGFGTLSHQSLRVDSGFFSAGYVQQVCRLSSRDLAEMIRRENPYFVAKLASVEVFARLYGMKQSIEEVDRHICDHIAMQVQPAK